MLLTDTVAFVTGANRGLGRALVDGLLARGAARVYAAARDPRALPSDPRITPIRLDVTDPAQVAAAAAAAHDAKLVVHNAGLLSAPSPLLSADLDAVERDLRTNFWGTVHVLRAFAPVLERNQGAYTQILTVVALGAMPALAGYSASKAAAGSLIQAVRGELAAKGVPVHAVYPGPIDTDMIRGFEMPKTSAADVAAAILDGVRDGLPDIFPDPMSRQVGDTWVSDPNAVVRQLGAM